MLIIPHQVRPIKFEFVSFRFVNPTSFVYGPKEENEPETCMSEKMNFTFHVREADCWDICNKLSARSCCMAPEDIICCDVPQPRTPLADSSTVTHGLSSWVLASPCHLPNPYLYPVTEAHNSLQYSGKEQTQEWR